MDGPGDRPAARPSSESDPLLGRQLGDFVLRECIGEGAFAAVYRSDQPLLGREAVVKVLHHRLQESEVVLQRFLREARLASRLDHPYAAHVYAFGVEPDDGLAWIAMELVHGTSLDRWLGERGALPLDMLVALFEQIAEIVQNAHDHGIVHRDLKPSNVMILEYAGKVFPKLLDFGIAKLVDQAQGAAGAIDAEDVLLGGAAIESGNIHLTQANATLGSPPYMPPEQWADPLSVGPRSDLYSLAVMAYEALTGRQPFTGPTIAAIGEQHCNAEVPPVGDGFPAALDRAFRRGLAKSPGDRPADAIAFARELRAAAFPHTDPESAITTTSMAPLSRRRPWPWVAGAAALGFAAVAAYLVLGGGDRAAATMASAAPTAAKVAAAPADQVAHADPTPTPTPAPTAPPTPVTTPAPASTGAVLAAAAPGGAAAPAPPVLATVAVEINSTPPGADVLRLPSKTRVGATPWKANLPSADGVQLFLIRKRGFGDRQVVVDLRTGGTHAVKLAPPGHKVPAATSPAARSPVRREGEPVDPFPPGTP